MALSNYTTTPFDFGFYDYFGPVSPFHNDSWMPVLGDEIERDANAIIRHPSFLAWLRNQRNG